MSSREDKKSDVLKRIEIVREFVDEGRVFIDSDLFREMLEHGLNDKTYINSGRICVRGDQDFHKCYVKHQLTYQGVDYITKTEKEIVI